jgi:ABC-type glycerol-3-phosphate transport system permease component
VTAHADRSPRRVRRGGLIVTLVAGALAAVWLVPLWILVTTAMKSTPEYTSDVTQWSLPDAPARLLDNIK